MLRWFRRGDVGLPWLTVGDPDGVSVVALPGLSDGLAPLSEPAARHAVRALPVEGRGLRIHLLSYRHPMGRDVGTRQLAADVAAFVDGVLDRPVAVVGHSMGGMVAQHVAADRPDLVTALALTATPARPDTVFCRRLRRWESLVTRHRWRDFHRDALSVSYTGRELVRRRLLLRLAAAPAAPHLVARHRALTRACLDHDGRARLGSIRCPTLVLAGASDPLVREPLVRELAAGIPHARLEVLAGHAHGFPEQARRWTYEAIVGLLTAAGDPVPGVAGVADAGERA